MSRRTQPVTGLDQADLVMVAAQVLQIDPTAVLDAADVAVLCGIADRLRVMTDVADAAAEVLVAIAAGRPFGDGDDAIAWLAAVVLIERNGMHLDGEVDGWVALVRSAAAGRIDERDVAGALAIGMRMPPGPVQRVIAAVRAPRGPALPIVHPCPVCGTDVDRSALWLFPVHAAPSPLELTAACARIHRTHDRFGHPRAGAPYRPPARWCPVVRDRGAAGPTPFVALTDRGPIAFRPRTWVSAFDVVIVDPIATSDLVGCWSTLWDHGRVVARIPADACRFDEAGTHLDWAHVAELLTDVLAADELVPA